jgi:Domain of unknown function (DUF4387)
VRAMAPVKLGDLATTVRSKNAGVNQITFDIILRSKEDYERVRRSGAVTRDAIARLFRIPPERISDFVEFDVANAVKFTIYRSRPSGSPGDWDVLGCQQYGPLLDIEIP